MPKHTMEYRRGPGRGLQSAARKKSDQHEAVDAYENTDVNPFEPGSRKWRIFERYVQNGVGSIGKPDQLREKF